MRAYSENLRDRVIKQWQAGKSQAEGVALFAVRAGSVKRWIKQYRQAGHVEAKHRTTWTYRLSPEQYPQLRQHRVAALRDLLAQLGRSGNRPNTRRSVSARCGGHFRPLAGRSKKDSGRE